MHWRNSAFQVKHFLAGKCHTADGAYRMLKELREERDVAIRGFTAANLRAEAKRMRATTYLASCKPGPDALEAKADLAEIDAYADQTKAVYEEALRERIYLDQLIKEIQPHRKFKHLTDPEAHQAAQQEEWKLEFIHRAKTFMYTTGSIPQDHLSTMMSHPEFRTEIAPVIERLLTDLKAGALKLTHMISSSVLPMLEGPDGL